MGILAADLSLYSGGYEAGERTFSLLTQAAGRAGRDSLPGHVVIQSYAPDHYSVEAAASQDYEGFYWHEILYRKLLRYPPVSRMLTLLITSREEEEAEAMARTVKRQAEAINEEGILELVGPAKASVAKINDIYRYMFYAKCEEEAPLLELKQSIEALEWGKNVQYQFDME